MAVLADEGLADAEFDLAEAAGGKVGGFVISPSFEGKSQLERQDFVWGVLDRHLTSLQRRRVFTLVTVTPREAKGQLPLRTRPRQHLVPAKSAGR